jgi:calcineurin-like phosphoesterase family protein
MAKKTPPDPPRRKREATDLHKLPRSAGLSYLYRAAEVAAGPNFPPESKFAPSALWQWIRSYLAYVFQRKHYFPDQDASPVHAMFAMAGDQGDDQVRIAVAGDWGTGTQEAVNVANNMSAVKPHYTIHLGDIYYVGDPPEVNENCLGIPNPNNNYTPVTWPIGEKGSFALNGNHEMYANGTGYFDMVLPSVGLRLAGGEMSGQRTSFLCLQNRFWRVIVIDTGYNSTGIPILSHIPLINRIPGVGGNCALRDELISWLVDTVKPQQDNRGLVILSHHQYYSAFDTKYRKPAQQLWKAGVQKHAVWFWGHEHRLAGYDLFGEDDLKVFGRCVGHGGMPVDRGGPVHSEPKPKFYDDRKSTNGFGVNGHVNLTFAGPRLEARYIDLNSVGNAEILFEQWEVDASGNCRQTAFERKTEDPDFHS